MSVRAVWADEADGAYLIVCDEHGQFDWAPDEVAAEVKVLQHRRDEHIRIEYRTLHQPKPPMPFGRVYSSSDNLEYQREDLAYLRGELGEADACIETRQVTPWERLDE